ncbi:MAG: hypothetical protein V3S71_06530 [Acidobacteriota bacterium]
MPLLGFDMVVQCRVCSETARVRMADSKGEKIGLVHFAKMVDDMAEQGMEPHEGDWLCWRHGSGRARAPELVPELHREKP